MITTNYLPWDENSNNSNLNNINFNKGIIPEVFNNLIKNDIIDWLHIDLNPYQATLDSLNQFLATFKNRRNCIV